MIIFGLYDWEVYYVVASDVLGKDIHSVIKKSEEDYKNNVDAKYEIGNYKLINDFPSMLEKHKDKLKIDKNKKYYIVIVTNNPEDESNTTYYLAISEDVLNDKSKYNETKNRIKDCINTLKKDIGEIGHPDYFPEEIYDMLMELYKKKKISDPKDWI